MDGLSLPEAVFMNSNASVENGPRGLEKDAAPELSLANFMDTAPSTPEPHRVRPIDSCGSTDTMTGRGVTDALVLIAPQTTDFSTRLDGSKGCKKKLRVVTNHCRGLKRVEVIHSNRTRRVGAARWIGCLGGQRFGLAEP